jgi:hypothetical protein
MITAVYAGLVILSAKNFNWIAQPGGVPPKKQRTEREPKYETRP